MPAEVDPIAGAEMFPKLQYAIAHWFTVAEQARLEAPQTNANPGLRLLVANRSKPFGKRLATVFGLISENLEHALL